MFSRIELDEDIASRLEAIAKARGVSARVLAGELLTQALGQVTAASPVPYVQLVRDFGAHLENPWGILVEMETEGYIQHFLRK